MNTTKTVTEALNVARKTLTETEMADLINWAAGHEELDGLTSEQGAQLIADETAHLVAWRGCR